MASIVQIGKRWRAQIRRRGASVSRTFRTEAEAADWARRQSEVSPAATRATVAAPSAQARRGSLPGTAQEKARERNRWHVMMARCYDPNSAGYKHFGAKGIRVCERWHTFANFYADLYPAPDGKSLDRFPDRNGDYEPGNVRWATQKQQVGNQGPQAPRRGRTDKEKAKRAIKHSVAIQEMLKRSKAWEA